MILFFKNILIAFPKSIIGELKNSSNKLDKRLMRVLSRTPLSNFFYNLYLFFFKKKNELNFISDNNLFQGIDDEQKVLSELEVTGIFSGFNVKRDIVEQVLESIKDQKFHVNREQNKTIYLNEKKDNDGIYICRYLNPHKNIKLIKNIAYDRTILNIAKNYFKTNPIVQSTQIWWTFSNIDKDGQYINPPGNEFGYHYDVDDFKFLKLFIYLSNVDEKSGPHYFISKKGKKKFSEYVHRRISDDEANKKYNERIMLLKGEKGTSFIEDTSNYHKGSNPEINKSRGILQVIYGISQW